MGSLASSTPEAQCKLLQDQVISETKEMVSSTVADAKDVVSGRVAELVDATKEALHSGVEAARSAVTSSMGMVMDSKVDRMDVNRAGAVLGRTGEDDSLPIGNEELAKLAAAGEGADVMPLEQQLEKRRYFVRLGSLSEKLHQFAYLHSKDQMKQVWQGMQEALGYLHSVMELEMESLALLLARSITQQLQITCSKVVSTIQGLPSSLQDRLRHSFLTVEELHASFLAANSLQDLSSTVLGQSQERLAVIYEYVEELLDYLSDNKPLSWLVGPFSPWEEEEEDLQEKEVVEGC